MNYENYRNAFSEVSLILNNSSVSIKNKIPKSFYNFLEKNKNEKYVPDNKEEKEEQSEEETIVENKTNAVDVRTEDKIIITFDLLILSSVILIFAVIKSKSK